MRSHKHCELALAPGHIRKKTMFVAGAVSLSRYLGTPLSVKLLGNRAVLSSPLLLIDRHDFAEIREGNQANNNIEAPN